MSLLSSVRHDRRCSIRLRHSFASRRLYCTCGADHAVRVQTHGAGLTNCMAFVSTQRKVCRPQTTTPAQAYHLFVGIDVSAATVTVAWMTPTGRSSRPLTIPQTATGYAALQHHLKATGNEPEATLVVLCWKPLARTGSRWPQPSRKLRLASASSILLKPSISPKRCSSVRRPMRSMPTCLPSLGFVSDQHRGHHRQPCTPNSNNG